ncbi:MAG: DUF711 family protein [Acidobacteria bacterium]|nr:DUF711 family protein [Acidobacteriota bacterium]
MTKTALSGLAALLTLCLIAPFAHAAEKPKVRAVTAFVRLDRATYEAQVREAVEMLGAAKKDLEQAGYEVQSIRIATQPFPEYIRGLSSKDALAFFRAYDALAQKEGFDAAIGPAMLRDIDDPAAAELLADVLLETKALNASLTVAAEDGVHWKSVHAAARLIKQLGEKSPRGQANFNFAATAMVPSNTPFFPGAYHRTLGREFAIALQSANVVAEALKAGHGDAEKARRELRQSLGEHAKRIEAVARQFARRSRWKYMGIDLSPAPLKDVSIGGALENFTGSRLGSSGTLTAAAAITAALRDIPVERAGYSGLMLPVLEDEVIARGWSEGALSVDALLAYSAVCGTGLDTIPLPGDVSVEQLERIIGDMATLAHRLRKPLSARLMPVAGKKAGDRTEFDDPFLVNAVIQPLP